MSTSNGLSSTVVLRCLGIAANAVCAGGLFIFPLFSPALVQHHHFTQPQLTTIVLSGMVGQYPFAAFVGKVLDARGARTCSLIAGFMFSLGFGLFAYEIADAPEVPNGDETVHVFRRMVVYFGLVGLGTVFSYFSIVFSATQTFPRYIGIASGTSMALFGCSPLLLTSIADHFFTTQTAAGETILNVTRFLTCLSLVTGLSHILGAVTLPGRSSTASPTTSPTREDNRPSELAIQERPSIHQPSPSTSGETTPLLGRRSLSPSSMSSKKSVAVEVDVVEAREVTPPQHGSTLDLICDPWFPTLLAVVAILVGCCEMVIANLSPIFLSLRSSGVPSSMLFAQGVRTLTAGSSISTQIQLLSVTNTLARLTIGPLADFMAPVPVSFSRGSGTVAAGSVPADAAANEAPGDPTKPKAGVYYAFPRAHYISRIAFLLGATLLCLTTFALFLMINSSTSKEGSMSLLSVGVGISYGTTFTILPGILTAIYGSANLGRNFGILSYAPFVGTSVFSYLFAFLLERNSSPPFAPAPIADSTEGPVAMCTGPQCWQTTFSVSVGALALACCVSGVLWRRWQGRV
ncbi:hypothetical protein PHLGIDRAFT_126758 [Phlebiopsis gigantea 11061_1 CR5-6]|uniref:Nodulin-like domain-containing protein n=1 Tax=Phlebiopsis gigantea (strain 11061_1 CR5-6) TaxID=745531 RepID=A0A0C3PPD8_PHLG1|nr:hypothetical protein PHLGIDRAFT_126758 [Phlebiopsis gigantea 11061_1 CR5-6]